MGMESKSMRAAAVIAIALWGLAAPSMAQTADQPALAAAEAVAEPALAPDWGKHWSDPAGRFVVTLPKEWPVNVRPANGFSFVIAGDEFAQCQFVATPRPTTADTRADMMLESTTAPITAAAWQTVINAMDGLFHDQGQVLSNSVDTTNFWPIQYARLMAPFGPLQGAIQFRPGLEIWTFCTTPGNIPADPRFMSVIRSVGTVNDLTMQADAVRLKAESEAEYARIQAAHAAALAAIREQQAAAEERQSRRGRRRRDDD